MSSNRRFLDNEDVVYQVCSHLSLVPYPLTDYNDTRMRVIGEPHIIRRTLAAAALSCRAFAVPASRTLWNFLPDGILPLVKIFSCITMKERQKWTRFSMGSYVETYYEFDGEISPPEWLRFAELASRVRCLSFLNQLIEPSVIEVLTSHCQRSNIALLPNLQILHWPESGGSESSLRLLKSLCSTPTLSLLEIFHGTKYGFSSAVDEDLAVICSTIPGLLHFRSSEQLSACQVGPILSMRNLRTLSLSAVTLPTFMLLGDLQHLSDLSTRLYSEETPDHAISIPQRGRKEPHRGFLSLRRLETSGSIEDLMTMVTLISSPLLIALSIHTSAVHTSDIIPKLVQVFTLPAVKTLERLKLFIVFDVEAFKDNSGERMEITFNDLAHCLYPITSLSVVNLHVSLRTISLSDGDIAQVKSAWPHLTALSVQSTDTTDHIQHVWQPSGVEIIRPSICSLVDLALNHPQLEGLDVEVASITEEDVLRLEERAATLEQASGVALDQTATPSASQPSLTWLTFARGDYRDHIGLPADLGRLASVLLRLFPRVGGLGKPIDHAAYVQRDGIRMFYMWSRNDMEKDIFRLLEKLETLKFRPFGVDYQGFLV